MISLAQAEAIADATLARGRELRTAPLTVVVLDAGGHLVVLKRADRSGILRPEIALAKAYGALGMGLSSREIARRAEAQPTFFATLAAVAGGRLAPAPGGVLVHGQEGDGLDVIGAVGVSGDVSDVDEACAVAGVLAAGLRPEPEVAPQLDRPA